MLPWSCWAEGLALGTCTLWWWPHRSVTSKHSFDTWGNRAFCTGGKRVGTDLHEKSSLCVLWGQMMGQTNSSTSPAFKNICFVCHHPQRMKRVWVQMPSYGSGGSCGSSKPPLRPATAVPCAWPLAQLGCRGLAATEHTQKVSLRNKGIGDVFGKQKQRGWRCHTPVCTHGHRHICSVSVFQKFTGTWSLLQNEWLFSAKKAKQTCASDRFICHCFGG